MSDDVSMDAEDRLTNRIYGAQWFMVSVVQASAAMVLLCLGVAWQAPERWLFLSVSAVLLLLAAVTFRWGDRYSKELIESYQALAEESDH